ncbi:hypothetical protein [Corynebacterium sp. MC3]|uniref:hypothetical protein n=1 Tax=Corynebacterium sp. MC3 TaxID=1720193 RepID=UPI0008DADD07|nr:hypothetical protein [Corynebacterium sp. MC3]
MNFVNHADHAGYLFQIAPEVGVIPIEWFNREKRDPLPVDVDETDNFVSGRELATVGTLWNAYLNWVCVPVVEVAKAAKIIGFGVAYLTCTDEGWVVEPASMDATPDAMLVSPIGPSHADRIARSYVNYLNSF